MAVEIDLRRYWQMENTNYSRVDMTNKDNKIIIGSMMLCSCAGEIQSEVISSAVKGKVIDPEMVKGLADRILRSVEEIKDGLNIK